MSLILGIETATEVCSVSLVRGGVVIATRESAGNNEHSQLLTPFISEVISENGFRLNEISAVAVSMGPGSYTGLRIGVSAAKGLCFSLDIPLIAIGTLKALAYRLQTDTRFQSSSGNNILLCPMIDARRMEVYMALYDENLAEINPVEAMVIYEDSFGEETIHNRIIVFGSGAEKCRDLLAHNNKITFLDEVKASASAIALLAENSFLKGDFVDTAYFEPFYLKDFIAAKPNIKGLR